jgi:hypothetical protein
MSVSHRHQHCSNRSTLVMQLLLLQRHPLPSLCLLVAYLWLVIHADACGCCVLLPPVPSR